MVGREGWAVGAQGDEEGVVMRTDGEDNDDGGTTMASYRQEP